MALKQHFTELKERLTVAMLSLGSGLGEGEGERLERLVKEVGEEGEKGLEGIMKELYRCLRALCKASSVSQSDEVSRHQLLVVEYDIVPV